MKTSPFKKLALAASLLLVLFACKKFDPPNGGGEGGEDRPYRGRGGYRGGDREGGDSYRPRGRGGYRGGDREGGDRPYRGRGDGYRPRGGDHHESHE